MLNIIRIGTFLTRYLFWQELAYQKKLVPVNQSDQRQIFTAFLVLPQRMKTSTLTYQKALFG